jgi:hypothetical protein
VSANATLDNGNSGPSTAYVELWDGTTRLAGSTIALNPTSTGTAVIAPKNINAGAGITLELRAWAPDGGWTARHLSGNGSEPGTWLHATQPTGGPAGAGGTGGMVRIAQVVVAGDGQPTIEFTGIPGTYDDLVLNLTGRLDVASDNTEVRMQVNASTGNNYGTGLFILETRLDSYMDAGVSYARLGLMPGTLAAAGDASAITCTIPAYAGTAFNKTWHSEGAWPQRNANNDFQWTGAMGRWLSTDAITAITLIAQSGNFVPGTVATLYGLGG